MKIARYEIFYADAGVCNACFLKLTTDDGTTGWSEFGEHTGTAGVSAVIRSLCELIIGKDPTQIELIAAFLRGRTIQALGGVNQHATAAIINALFDIKGKAAGLPVHAFFGGALRNRIPIYWSHCGAYRILYSDIMRKPPVRTLDDIAKLGEEARQRGFKAIKTGMTTIADDGRLADFAQGYAFTPSGYAELNLDRHHLRSTVSVMEAFRDGAGPDVGLMLDINCHFRTEGYLEVVRAMEPFDLLWLEFDILDPQATARIRSAATFPIASLETVYGTRGLRPYLEAGAVDVAIIDVAWNGYLDAMKMAQLAAAYEVNIAPHSYAFGGLADVANAHFAAAVPNLRIMEFDIDEVPWKWDFLSEPLRLENGELVVPQKPGWGVDVDEKALRAHPPR